MARLYSNENFPLPVVEELRRLGHSVLTIQETGKANQAVPDESGVNLCHKKGTDCSDDKSQAFYSFTQNLSSACRYYCMQL